MIPGKATLAARAVLVGCGAPDGALDERLGRTGITFNRWQFHPIFLPPLLQARNMAAQEYYRGDYSSRPLSPPTNTFGDTSGNYDRYNTADVDERLERATTPSSTASFENDKFNTLPSPSHERNTSAFTDTPGYGRIDSPYEEEGDNQYRKNYNMVNQDEESKEALVPPVRDRRSSGYQDLGAFSYLCLHFRLCQPYTYSWVIRRVRRGEHNQPSGGTCGARWEGREACPVAWNGSLGAANHEQTEWYRSPESSVGR